jgi:hypothetical protein
MFTTFTLLIAAGVGFRLTLSWALRSKFDLGLFVPKAVARPADAARHDNGAGRVYKFRATTVRRVPSTAGAPEPGLVL